MKKKHSGNTVTHHFWCENTWWLHLIWFLFQISTTKWNEADQTRWRSHLIALHTPTLNSLLSSLSVGMDIVMDRWWTILLLQMMGCWMVLSLTAANTVIPKYISHTQKMFHTQILQASNKPGHQKTINGLYRQQCCKTSVRSGESSDVSRTPKDKAKRRYGLVASTIYGTEKTRQILKCHLVTFWRS